MGKRISKRILHKKPNRTSNKKPNKISCIDIVQYVETVMNKFHNVLIKRKWFVLIVVKINHMDSIIAKDVLWLIYILNSPHLVDIIVNMLKYLVVHHVDFQFEKTTYLKNILFENTF